MTHTVPCSGVLWTIALCTRFVLNCSRSVCEPMVRVTSPDVSMVRPRFSARGRSVSVASSAMRDRSTCSRGEGPLVGAAEHEQRFGEVDRSGVDGVEAVDEFVVVAVRIVPGDVEQCLRDRQRRAQFVGGVGCEPLLFGDLCLEAREHGVEGVGELAELVAAARQPDPVRQRSARGDARGVCDAVQGGEHPAGEKPPSHETEHEQERHHDGRDRSEIAEEVVVAGTTKITPGCTPRER